MASETNELGTSIEQRLATLTEAGAEILRRWSLTADRHAAAVSHFETQLRELSAAGTHLHEDAAQRLQDLERVITQEWDALRQLHEAPVKTLVEQAANLTEVCLATANSAQSGFDRAETRLAALESEFQRRTSELTQEIRALMIEVRSVSANHTRQLLGEAPSPSWPLEGVTRLHNQLREGAAPTVSAVLALPESPASAPPTDVTPPRSAGIPRSHRPVVRAAVIAVLAAAAGLFAWQIERDVRVSAEQAQESQRQLRVAADAAARAAAEKQEDAVRQLAAAQQLATRAQAIGDVLAAPDLVRYPLTGRDSLAGANGQVLWSRSRGLVFSASGLPAPPENSTYQIWLLTRAGAISAGTFSPDPGGRITIASTPRVAPPLVGAIVTMEPKGGGPTPSGQPLLARVPISAGT